MKNFKQKEIQTYFYGTMYGLAIFMLVSLASCNKETFTNNKGDLKDPATLKSKARVTVHSGSSIQSAVDAAGSNTIIYIEPGIYSESIVVNKPGIELIGLTGKGDVVIQNPGDEEDGVSVNADGDGFVLKNVTVKGFEDNGVLLVGTDNFLLDHVIAIDNREYGLFPVHCNNGVIENCTATGSADTGIYVGQSSNITVTNNVAFANVSGFEIENCNNVKATLNESYNNTAGLLVFLLPGLDVKSSSNILVSHNKIHDNNLANFSTPEGGLEFFIPKGMGILLLGADNTTIEHNLVRGNNFVGIAAVSTLLLGVLNGAPPEAFADIEPNPDGARILHNVLQANGKSAPPGLPLPAADLLWDGSGTNNCWQFNVFSSSYPASLPACN
ncbi:hypothetical protein BH10BAC3_BH10BAC3_25920 [soil metagenome]